MTQSSLLVTHLATCIRMLSLSSQPPQFLGPLLIHSAQPMFGLPAFPPPHPMSSVCKRWQHFQLEPRTQSVFLNRKRRKAFPFLDAESPGATARGMVCGLPAPEAPCADRLCL